MRPDDCQDGLKLEKDKFCGEELITKPGHQYHPDNKSTTKAGARSTNQRHAHLRRCVKQLNKKE